MTEDLRTFVALVRARYPHAVVAVVGESLGGAVAIEAFASDRPPAADRLVLAAPAVWGWSSQPLAYKLALHGGRAPGARPRCSRRPASSPSTSRPATTSAELERDGPATRWMIWGARSDALYGLVNTMQHGWEDIGRVRAPTLYLLGAHDQIIPADAGETGCRAPAGRRPHRLLR